tara:strand:+ start:278 stop:451 length:174 start_codon:yes stop_codon:yes gene_type:complete
VESPRIGLYLDIFTVLSGNEIWLAQAGVFFAMINVIKLIPYSMNEVWQMALFLLDLV